VDLAWTFSSAGVRNERLLTEIALQSWRRIGDFDAAELGDLCQILSSEGIACPKFFDARVQQVEGGPASPFQLSAVVSDASRAREQLGGEGAGYQSTTAVEQLEASRAMGQLPSLSTVLFGTWAACAVDAAKLEMQRGTGSTAVCEDDERMSEPGCDWSSEGDSCSGKACVRRTTAWADIDPEDDSVDAWACDDCGAAAELQDSCREDSAGGRALASAEPGPVYFTVKNTFLMHYDEEISEKEAKLRRRLPPAIERLVRMPREEFEALRVRHQMLRDF
jgi:hypothetical protein